MQRSSRVLPVVLLITAAVLGAGFAGLRAVAQNAPATPPPKAEAPKAEAPAKPAAPSRRPSADDADSAQAIEDDPTVAPDPEESADNNITFPIDI